MEIDRDKLVADTVAKLMEHFDCVQIFASKHDGEKEESNEFVDGSGSFLTRYGQITLWIERIKAYERKQAVKNDGEKDDPSDEVSDI